MSRKIELPNLDDLIRRYLAGESLKQLAEEAGVSRGGRQPNGKWFGLTRMFVAAGVKLRGRSEAERRKWAHADPAKRRQQVAAAHEARRGQIDSEAVKVARAQTRHRRLTTATADERLLHETLREFGIRSQGQFPLSKYNLDLALEELRVAVELTDSWNKGNYPTELFDRTKDILNRGWSILFVIGPLVDAVYVARKVIAFADAIRRDKTLLGQYGVIGGQANRGARGSAKLKDLPRVPGF